MERVLTPLSCSLSLSIGSVFKDTKGTERSGGTKERGTGTGNGERETGTGGGVSLTPPPVHIHVSKKLKYLRGAIENAPPPPQKKIVFGLRSASQNRYIVQTMILSKKLLIFTL